MSNLTGDDGDDTAASSRLAESSHSLDSSIDPSTGKSNIIFLLDFTSKHTKNFHFAWISFCAAFLSWFAFPSIIKSVQNDLKLTNDQVANSNILGLSSTVFVRLIAGYLCDEFGPRITMAIILLLGAAPTACAFLVKDATGFYLVRFCIGILGGSFVPCQVWTTAFYDKSVVGTANALAGGWGNMGGGIAFFVLPAIVSALEGSYGYSESNAWRMAIVIGPSMILVVCAIVILLYGDDCPKGKWKNRVTAVDLTLPKSVSESNATLDTTTFPSISVKGQTASHSGKSIPTLKDSLSEVLAILVCPQTAVLFISYLCCFGGEIALESYLVPWYTRVLADHKRQWSQQQLGNLGSIFGLANVITRPLGGYISDLLYESESNTSTTTLRANATSTSLRGKKTFLLLLLGIQGIVYFLLSFIPNLSIENVLVLSTILAVASEVGNGVVYSLVPHIHIGRNGYVSGFVGAGGNIGGVLFSVLYRFMRFSTAFWVAGLFVWVIFIISWVVPLVDEYPQKFARGKDST